MNKFRGEQIATVIRECCTYYLPTTTSRVWWKKVLSLQKRLSTFALNDSNLSSSSQHRFPQCCPSNFCVRATVPPPCSAAFHYNRSLNTTQEFARIIYFSSLRNHRGKGNRETTWKIPATHSRPALVVFKNIMLVPLQKRNTTCCKELTACDFVPLIADVAASNYETTAQRFRKCVTPIRTTERITLTTCEKNRQYIIRCARNIQHLRQQVLSSTTPTHTWSKKEIRTDTPCFFRDEERRKIFLLKHTTEENNK